MRRIAIDFGSSETKICLVGSGVVLKESTCIAIEAGEEEDIVKAYGDKARALSGRAAVNTTIINPVFEGDIVDEVNAARLLSHFLEKIEITRRRARYTEVIFIIPCGSGDELQDKYRRVADACGLGAVYFTVTPFAAVLGHNVAISESAPMFSIDIGYGVTTIAALSQDGLIYGLTLNIGGGNIDKHIIDELADKRKIKIGALTAEKIKNTVGSLLRDDNKMIVVDGRNLGDGTPASIAVNSSHIYEYITAYIDKILEYVFIVMGKLDAEAVSGIVHGGIFLSGGLIKMDGLAEYISDKLHITVNLPDEPQLACVFGAGTILSNDYLFSRFATD